MSGAVQGNHRALFGRFKFRVKIAGITQSAFQSATGLKYTVAKIEYWEGGALIAYKEPGRVTFDDLALERGVSYEEEFYDWLLEVVNIVKFTPRGGGTLSPRYKKNLSCNQLERDNKSVIEYKVRQAFPIEWAPGDMDNTSDEVSVEMITLTYDYFTRKTKGAAPTS